MPFGELLRGILSAGAALPQGLDAAAAQDAAAAKTRLAQDANLLSLQKLLQADTQFRLGQEGLDRRLGTTQSAQDRRLDVREAGANARAQAANQLQQDILAETKRANTFKESPITVPPVPRDPGNPDKGHMVIPPVDPRGVAPILGLFKGPDGGRGTEAKLRVELSGRLQELEKDIREGRRTPNDQEYQDVIQRLDIHSKTSVPPFAGVTGSGTEFSRFGPNALSPAGADAPSTGIRRAREPLTPPSDASALGVLPGGTVREDLAAARAAGRSPFTAAQKSQFDAAQQSKGLIAVIERDLNEALKTATSIKGPLDRFTGAPGRFFDVHLQTNPKLATIHSRIQGTLAKLARAFGEVGTLNEGDIQRARDLWPNLAPGLTNWDFGAFKLPITTVLPDTDEVIELKITGLKEFLGELEGRIAVPRAGQGSAPPRPAAPAAPAPATPALPGSRGGWGPMTVR